jgi:hypothetical protein
VAKILIVPDGRRALHFAAEFGNEEIEPVLLREVANAMTPLDVGEGLPRKGPGWQNTFTLASLERI